MSQTKNREIVVALFFTVPTHTLPRHVSHWAPASSSLVILSARSAMEKKYLKIERTVNSLLGPISVEVYPHHFFFSNCPGTCRGFGNCCYMTCRSAAFFNTTVIGTRKFVWIAPFLVREDILKRVSPS